VKSQSAADIVRVKNLAAEKSDPILLRRKLEAAWISIEQQTKVLSRMPDGPQKEVARSKLADDVKFANLDKMKTGLEERRVEIETYPEGDEKEAKEEALSKEEAKFADHAAKVFGFRPPLSL